MPEVPFYKQQLTNAGSCRNWIQADPKRHPGQDDKQSRRDVGLQNEVKDISSQFKVQNQSWVIAYWESDDKCQESKISIRAEKDSDIAEIKLSSGDLAPLIFYLTVYSHFLNKNNI